MAAPTELAGRVPQLHLPLSVLTFTMYSRYKSILEHEPFLLKCRVLVGLIQRGTIFIFSTYIHLVLSPWV